MPHQLNHLIQQHATAWNHKSYSTCLHLLPYKLAASKGGIERFRAIQLLYLQVSASLQPGLLLNVKATNGYCSSSHDATSTFSTSALPKCTICNEMSSQKLFVCLECVHFGCAMKHAASHAISSDHNLALSLAYNHVFCFRCKDFVYDSDLESVSVEEIEKWKVGHDAMADGDRFAVSFKRWAPSLVEQQLLRQYTENISINENNGDMSNEKSRISMSLLGLRGLNNLGNTCFMNSVLQSLVHTPVLAAFFLSERHSHRECSHSRWRYSNNTPSSENGTICMGCEMDKLFAEHYSGERRPFSPQAFLYAVWRDCAYLADKEQQDAHEFLVATLNALHQHCRWPIDGQGHEGNAPEKSRSIDEETKETSNTLSIVDCIFNGRLRSDVTCQTCHNTSSTVDPFRDLSLNIKPDTPPSPKALSNVSRKSSSVVKKNGGSVDNISESVLTTSAVNCRDREAIVSTQLPRMLVLSPTPSQTTVKSSLSSSSSDPTLAADTDDYTLNGNSGLAASDNVSNISSDTGTRGCKKRKIDSVNARSQPTSVSDLLQSFQNSDAPVNDLFVQFVRATESTASVTVPRTLNDCLQRFTHPEMLGKEERFFCSVCHNYRDSMKQLSIDRLPVVLMIHLKRFEHSHRRAKISNHITFPLQLDMTPFTSSSRPQNGANGDGASQHVAADKSLYTLHAVVNHFGALDAGHYTSYVRHHDNWFLCDDAVISRASLSEVLESEAYLLFYVKNRLEYTSSAVAPSMAL